MRSKINKGSQLLKKHPWLQHVLSFCVLGLAIQIAPEISFADGGRLVSAARSAADTIKTIGIAAAGIGTGLAGVCFMLGASQFGRMLLTSAVVGGVVLYGAPSVMSSMQNWFGA